MNPSLSIFLCTLLSVSIFGWRPIHLHAQKLPTGQELLEKSLAYHDPENAWYSRNHVIELVSKRPVASDRISTIYLYHAASSFGMDLRRDGLMIQTKLNSEDCSATIDGKSEISKEQEDTYRLSCEGITRWRDYHGYMLGLPMKLNDPGTMIHQEVRRVSFSDRDVLAIRVTYDEEVGKDIWYMYFDPTTFALVGTRFYHDETKNEKRRRVHYFRGQYHLRAHSFTQNPKMVL